MKTEHICGQFTFIQVLVFSEMDTLLNLIMLLDMEMLMKLVTL